MSFLVKEITVQDGFEDFLSIPSEIYRNDPYYIAPQSSEVRKVLNPLKNPYFLNASLKIYVCYSDGTPVCRSIMVINHLHWTKWHQKSAFFGFFESLNDCDAVKCLFEKIEVDCRAARAEYLEGPFNPNHYSELGILMDNFNSAPVSLRHTILLIILHCLLRPVFTNQTGFIPGSIMTFQRHYQKKYNTSKQGYFQQGYYHKKIQYFPILKETWRYWRISTMMLLRITNFFFLSQ